jgi:AraC-like ligand binding domain
MRTPSSLRAARAAEVTAWRPSVPGVAEVFHARFVDHVYPAHTHDAWTLLIVDDGAVRFDLDRHQHGALTSQVTLLPPHVPHDGRPATPRGFRKRVLYLDTGQLGEELIGAAVDRPLHSHARYQPWPIRAEEVAERENGRHVTDPAAPRVVPGARRRTHRSGRAFSGTFRGTLESSSRAAAFR